MPHFDKLLTDVGPDDPPARAAQRALKTRLRAVRHYLHEAAASGQSVEGIHQLRIWTRRSGAALALFAPLLPARRSKKLKRMLRKLRRKAGAVRDLDVLEAQLAPALEGTIPQQLLRQRKSARRDLRRLIRRLQASDKLKRRSRLLLKRVGRESAAVNGVSFASWCRRQLRPLIAEFSRHTGRGVTRNDAELHRWRLATKRLRYALELAVAALPQTTWKQSYELLSELQERLGTICDLLVQRQRLAELAHEVDDEFDGAALAKMRQAAERSLTTAKRQLDRWWTVGRRMPVAALVKQASAQA